HGNCTADKPESLAKPQRRASQKPVGQAGKTSIARRCWHDGNTQSIVGAKTDLIAGHANNAGIPRTEHLDAGPPSQTELFQAVDMVRPAKNPAYPRRLAGSQLI